MTAIATRTTERANWLQHLRTQASIVSPLGEKDDLSHFSGRLGARIRKRRKEKGLSRKDFAANVTALLEKVEGKGASLTVKSLSSYENGHRPIPLNLVPYLAIALDCTVRSLVPNE